MKLYFKIIIIFSSIIFSGNTINAQEIIVNDGSLKQKITFMGADFERSQNFVQKATNPNELLDWAFNDIEFNLCRVAYDKIQKTENRKFEVEVNNITATGTYVQWQLLDAGNGHYYIQNVGSNTQLQCVDTKLDDNSGNFIYSRPANSCTGTWCKWEFIESTSNPGYFNIRNVGLNKYLQSTDESSGNTGNFIKAVDVNTANAEDEASLWSTSQQGSSATNIFIDNKGFGKRLRYTDVDEIVENMAFYDDAIVTMKTIKSINPDVNFLATMRSDYNGYKSDNWNNLPKYIYNYSCVETNDAGSCIRTLGNKSFDTDAYGVFLADYLELMFDNGVAIDYLATAKEWTSIVTPVRSHDVYVKLVSECNLRGLPIPEIIAPGSWSLSQGVVYANDVGDLGYEDEYHSFSSHNLNSEDDLFDDFVLAATELGKTAWNDETSAGGGSRTNGVNPDISLAIDAYIEKTKLYQGGLIGECFFEINSRGVDSETRTIYFTKDTEAKRLRSYYIMKNFANNVVDKNYTETTVSSLQDTYAMSFNLDGEFTLVVINNSDINHDNVPISFDNLQLTGEIQQIEWLNTSSDEGDNTTIIKEEDNLFRTSLRAKSINIYTYKNDLLSTETFDVEGRVEIYPNPVSEDFINVKIDNSFLTQKISFKLTDLSGRIVKQGILNTNKKINTGFGLVGVYLLQLKSSSFIKTFKVIVKQQ
ncbi:T9SS type A sorting domain-containing protein [Flavicella sp.]|uniref:T9SS type A sorting domain-containing protein n=1 Tax=Flavicella sp. TaxID=2957742 RepID=UPI00301744C4